MVRPTRWRTACAALIAVLVIAGCGGSGSTQTRHSATPAVRSSSSTRSATTTTTAAAATASTTSTPTAQATATANAVGGAPTCQTSSLRLTLASGGGAAGTSYSLYDLTNVGSSPCSMIGYPGVAVLDAGGRVVQHPALRGAAVPAPVRRVNLEPGRRARFLVNSTDVIPSPGCPRAYSGTTLQVYPPNQRTAIRLPRTGAFCNLRVGPVQPVG